MAKKKEPGSWQDKLQNEPEPLPSLETIPEDRLVKAIAEVNKDFAEHRIRDLEVQVQVLRRELYLAKARVIELELKAKGIATES